MQRKEKENIQKKDNSSDDEYFSEGNDDDYFVDNALDIIIKENCLSNRKILS